MPRRKPDARRMQKSKAIRRRLRPWKLPTAPADRLEQLIEPKESDRWAA